MIHYLVYPSYVLLLSISGCMVASLSEVGSVDDVTKGIRELICVATRLCLSIIPV